MTAFKMHSFANLTALLAIPLVRAAVAAHAGMSTFAEAGLAAPAALVS